MFKQTARKPKGQGLVEYALILTLISIVVIAILVLMGPAIGNVFSGILAASTLVSPGASGESSPGGGGPPADTPAPGVTPSATPPGGPPPECYSSLLLPLTLAVAGAAFTLLHFFPGLSLSPSWLKRF